MDDKQNSITMLPLLLGFLVAGSLGTLASTTLPELLRAFEITVLQSSLLYVVWGVGIVIGSLSAARALSRFGPGPILTSAALIGALAAHVGAKAVEFTPFVVAYLVLGIAAGTIITSGHGFIGRKSNPNSASNISALDFALSLGTLSAPLLIAYIGARSAGDDAWRQVLQLLCICLVALAGFVSLLDLGGKPPARKRKVAPRPGFRALLGPVMIWFGIVNFLHHAFEYGHTYWFVTYASGLPEISENEARHILAGFLSGVIVSRLVLSWFANIEAQQRILSVAVAVALALIVFMPTYVDYTSLYLANVAFGATVGVVFPSLLALVVSTSDDLGAAFSSVALISGSLGAQFSALLLGIIVEHGPDKNIYVALAIIGLPLLVSVNLLIRHCKSQRQQVTVPVSAAESESFHAQYEALAPTASRTAWPGRKSVIIKSSSHD